MAPQQVNDGQDSTRKVHGGLGRNEWTAIVLILLVGLATAVVLVVGVPRWLVDGDYSCIPAGIAGTDVTPGCEGRAGADGIDNEALDAARSSARAPFGVLAGAVLAGAAAAIGVIVSSHNARLTQLGIEENRRTNAITEKRDQETADRDRARTDDERFTTAVEQLGNTSASVRLGGLYSLQRLALAPRPQVTKTPDPSAALDRLPVILDIICAYLRQPFHHPDHDWKPPTGQDDPTAELPPRAWWPVDQKQRDERDAEREVRRTAARLIATLLPAANSPNPEDARLGINLNGAMLDGLDLTGRRMDYLQLTSSYLAGDLRLSGAHIDGNLWLGEGAHIDGDLELGEGAHIDGILQLGEGAHIDGTLWLFGGAHIDGNLWLGEGAHIVGDLQLREGAHIDGDLRLFERAYIDGDLWLGEGTFIVGDLLLGEGAHIDGDLLLGEGAHIDGLWLGEGAHIDGDLTLGVEAQVKEVHMHPRSRMASEWFTNAGVPKNGSPVDKLIDSNELEVDPPTVG